MGENRALDFSGCLMGEVYLKKETLGEKGLSALSSGPPTAAWLWGRGAAGGPLGSPAIILAAAAVSDSCHLDHCAVLTGSGGLTIAPTIS